MAIHSSVLAWRIPWTEEPGGLQSMGSRVRHDWTDLACMHSHLSCSVSLFTMYSLVVDPADIVIMQPNSRLLNSTYLDYSPTRAFQVVLIQSIAHTQCYKWSQLLHNHVFTKCGAKARGYGAIEPNYHHLGQLLFPSNIPNPEKESSVVSDSLQPHGL